MSPATADIERWQSVRRQVVWAYQEIRPRPVVVDSLLAVVLVVAVAVPQPW
jgi:hypothetical protein